MTKYGKIVHAIIELISCLDFVQYYVKFLNDFTYQRTNYVCVNKTNINFEIRILSRENNK